MSRAREAHVGAPRALIQRLTLADEAVLAAVDEMARTSFSEASFSAAEELSRPWARLWAARFADEFNVPFADVDTVAAQYRRVDEACATHGRDPREIVRSAALVLCCGRNPAEIARRADAIGRDVDELRANGAAGTPAEVADAIGRYAAVGTRRVYLQVLDMSDLDHLELVASEVARQL